MNSYKDCNALSNDTVGHLSQWAFLRKKSLRISDKFANVYGIKSILANLLIVILKKFWFWIQPLKNYQKY